MSQKPDAPYERWLISKDTVLRDAQRVQNSLSSGVIKTDLMRCFLESASCHVSLQSEKFYQTLRGLCHGNSSSLVIVGFLADDLNFLRVELFAFGERYLGDWPVIKLNELRSDWGCLAQLTAQRILLEESQLGPLLRMGQKVGCEE